MMVHFVNVLVDGAMVQELVDPVMPRVLDYQTHHHLQAQNVPGEK